ncbi:MAG: class IV adenylate cyclase [Phycisphaeraceae bacterium]|nr:class IV adenylate cyclase [Phycisphaeraceae bacterium]
MPIEIEIKMRLEALEPVEAALEAAGGKSVQRLQEHNTYFDTPDHSLKSSDQGLRLRVERWDDQRQIVITHKGPRAHGRTKTRAENEVEVTSTTDAARLLTALGYVPVMSFEKRRRRWTLDGCQVELDTVPYIGSFIEIEGPSEEAVLAVRKKLDLEDRPLIQASYIALLTTHLQENGIQRQHVSFDDDPAEDPAAPAAATA